MAFCRHFCHRQMITGLQRADLDGSTQNTKFILVQAIRPSRRGNTLRLVFVVVLLVHHMHMYDKVTNQVPYSLVRLQIPTNTDWFTHKFPSWLKSNPSKQRYMHVYAF
jgi:hypothetical protein